MYSDAITILNVCVNKEKTKTVNRLLRSSDPTAEPTTQVAGLREMSGVGGGGEMSVMKKR